MKTGQEIQKEAENMLLIEMEESKINNSVWIRDTIWWVLHSKEQNGRKKTIPVFHRVHAVTVDSKRLFKCCSINFDSFDVKDIDERYPNNYCMYAATKKE